MVVVRQAGQGQIGGHRPATMLLGDDVVDLETSRRIRQRKLAVFAAVTRTPAHKVRKCILHGN
jgi:hypothetical protein